MDSEHFVRAYIDAMQYWLIQFPPTLQEARIQEVIEGIHAIRDCFQNIRISNMLNSFFSQLTSMPL